MCIVVRCPLVMYLGAARHEALAEVAGVHPEGSPGPDPVRDPDVGGVVVAVAGLGGGPVDPGREEGVLREPHIVAHLPEKIA